MRKLRKNIISIVLIIATILSSFVGVFTNTAPVFARTEDEAIEICKNLPKFQSYSNTTSNSGTGNTIKCISAATADECKNAGGTFTGGTSGASICLIGFTKTKNDEVEKKRKECEAKGGQFYVRQIYSDGTVSYDCRTSSDNPNGNPSNADAAILTECASIEKGGGEGIKCVVITVINIMSVLVGIVGIIGIVVVGIQYLTAGGNEEQTRKAKRRLFEIIIGIALYFVTAALLNWLLPEFHPDTNNTSLIPSIIAIIGG